MPSERNEPLKDILERSRKGTAGLSKGSAVAERKWRGTDEEKGIGCFKLRVECELIHIMLKKKREMQIK